MFNIHVSISLYIFLELAIYFVGALSCGLVGWTVRLASGGNGVRIKLFRYKGIDIYTSKRTATGVHVNAKGPRI